MERQDSNLPHLAFAGLSQAVRTGRLVAFSGQVALGAEGVVGEGDARAQAEQCFDNIDALLAAAGAGRADVVKLTCFLVDAGDYPAYAAAKAARFDGHAPAGTCVVVESLLDPRFLLEVEALAVICSP